MRTGWGKQHLHPGDDGTTIYGTRPYSVTSGRGLSQGLLDFGDLVWEETWQSSNYNSFQITLQRDIGSLRLPRGVYLVESHRQRLGIQ